jgi:hypothetical protein
VREKVKCHAEYRDSAMNWCQQGMKAVGPLSKKKAKNVSESRKIDKTV